MTRLRQSLSQQPVVFYDHYQHQDDFGDQVLAGLEQTPKSIPTKFFYNQRGSELFDAICGLPEYYLTRADLEIIEDHASDIANLIDDTVQLVEFGSGSSRKVRLLLDGVRPTVYMPIDISRDHLLASANLLAEDYPWLAVHAVCMDYSRSLELPYHGDGLALAAFFPGSSIGNFEPDSAHQFLVQAKRMLKPGGTLIIGVDLKKETSRLEAAYNDADGITAAFNLNLLQRMNEELDADFDPAQFRHRAFYNENRGRIEMHIESLRPQTVTVCGRPFSFAAGETVHTENSYKYSIAEFQQLAASAGFHATAVWTDHSALFSVHVLTARASVAH
jgi:dimethylhistidine N-methyltransferase